MKLLVVNSVPYGSTATISYGISKIAEEKGISTLVAYGYSKHPIDAHYLRIGGYLNKAFHIFFSHLTGLHGFYSYLATLKFLRQVRKFDPDIIHLHNLHGWYINIPLLIDYINKYDKKVVWTLHDCWAFTGHCAYFDISKCDKWMSHCKQCPSIRKYPESYIDASNLMFNKKREWFSSIKNLTIVTPSEWLQGLVALSFLKNKRCMVINNGIDLKKFNILPAYHRTHDKFRILGLSIDWSYKKGLDVFIQLSELLDDSFEITLVGTNHSIDEIIPKSIVSVHRTQNQEELARMYNECDVFVNPTREDNFPTVNIEALACGLPVITFKTGGSPEIIDESCGIVVPKNDIDALVKAIKTMKEKPLSREACRKRSLRYDRYNKFVEYITLYNSL